MKMTKELTIKDVLSEEDFRKLWNKRQIEVPEPFSRLLDQLKYKYRNDQRISKVLEPMKPNNLAHHVKSWARKSGLILGEVGESLEEEGIFARYGLNDQSVLAEIAGYLQANLLRDLEQQVESIRDYEDKLKFLNLSSVAQIRQLSKEEKERFKQFIDSENQATLTNILIPSIPGYGQGHLDNTIIFPITYSNPVQTRNEPSSALYGLTDSAIRTKLGHVRNPDKPLVEQFGSLTRYNSRGPPINCDQLSQIVSEAFNAMYKDVTVRFIQHPPILLHHNPIR